MDNLNIYNAWLPAGQQTDRYSSQPWCLRSKNLDIFSSSKSVKATAWSEPVTWDDGIIASEWGLVLKTDWKVYERVDGVDTLFVDPSVNFPVYKVSYNWKNGTYADAQWGTPQDLVVASDESGRKSFVVFTDRASYTYSKVKYVPQKKITSDKFQIKYDWDRTSAYGAEGFWFDKRSGTWQGAYIDITVESSPFANRIPVKLFEHTPNGSVYWIQLDSVTQRVYQYYYDPEMDAITANSNGVTTKNIPFTWLLKDTISLELPTAPAYWTRITYRFEFSFTLAPWVSETAYNWDGLLCIDINQPDSYSWELDMKDWDYNEYYSYLPVKDRELVDVGTYYWMKWTTFQPFYEWQYTWVEPRWASKVARYDLVQYMGRPNPLWMEVVWMISWNEQIYMIWNFKWDWYIIPCDLTWWTGTPYIAYGCEFKWATNIDYLLYLVWDDRWISTLWVFNQQELVSVIWWKQEVQYNDLVGVEEQYKFDWKIVNWRKNLILSTSDNRLFQYWQTYGGKGWSFIHELPENATVTWLKANWNDLEVDYSITASWTTTNYKIKYQDDTPIRNYNTEWEATYPIVIWNHLLEKEESDLYCSYILPSADTSLEFWASANHYHFWTFKTDWSFTPTVWSKWMIDGTDFNYYFEFVEKNWGRLTFRLVWDLPAMTGQETMTLTEFMSMLDPHYISYTEFNHFRKIWEITTTEYKEWEFRFHNLNNKLELPKSHSLQIMVRGKGDQAYTPELFALDLVANQRDRW